MGKKQAEDPGKAIQIMQWIIDRAMKGVPPMKSARDLADEYLNDSNYTNHDERVDGMIRWEASKNAVSGLITSMGGILVLPAAIPAALGASWVIQARLAAAVAAIYDHDIKEDRVRTLVLLSLVGDAAKELLKGVGVQIAGKVGQKLLEQVPGRLLIEINKQIGFRLLTKGGTTGIINLVRLVPLLGWTLAASIDAYVCGKVGRIAQNIFRPSLNNDQAAETAPLSSS